LADRAYFLSPANGSADPYHAIPLVSDSMKGATYGSLVLCTGFANQHARDGIYSLQARMHRSHNFGHVQGYYGASLILGNYSIAKYSNYQYLRDFFGFPYPSDSGYLIQGRNAFFGIGQANAGIDFVIPFSNRSEWRVLGLEGSFQDEFGNYLHFRKQLPDTAANVILRLHEGGTFGICSDIISRPSRRNAEFGYKVAWGVVVGSTAAYSRFGNNNIFPLTYFSQTLHLTKGRFTSFIQVNIGSYATNLQTGVNYRIGPRNSP
jgi:hypothetical protein